VNLVQVEETEPSTDNYQVCINQKNTVERSHQVSFMGDIYRNAKKVLVYIGKDSDGGAEDVDSLVHDISKMILKYNSITDMHVLNANDALYDDPRWKALATLHRLPWFTRAWVIQEVGLAKDPRVLYGGVEFSYRDLVKLAVWTMRCAPNLNTKAGIDFFSIHADWLDWSNDWHTTKTYPNETFVDLLNQARWLSCSDPRDHIYSLLGHPLARSEDRSSHGRILYPDYNKDPMDVWFDLALRLLAKHGLRILSAVNHNEDNLATDYPSWVPWCWPEIYTICSLGAAPRFYYAADGGMSVPPSIGPVVDEMRQLHVQGVVIDVVRDAFAFTSADLAASPAKLRSMASSASQVVSSAEPNMEPHLALRSIWSHVQKLAANSATAYGSDWLTAFSITLIAGITTYTCAEDNIAQHRRDFAAYFSCWLRGVFGPNTSEFDVLLPTLAQSKGEGEGDVVWATERDEGGDDGDGDADRFFVDLKLMCQGRSFFFMEKGYFGLGPWIARPGDRVCILFGAKCPVLLRDWGMELGTGRRYKLVQDAYVHGLMRGEAMERIKEGKLAEDFFIIC
jgi:hypothetical protein